MPPTPSCLYSFLVSSTRLRQAVSAAAATASSGSRSDSSASARRTARSPISLSSLQRASITLERNSSSLPLSRELGHRQGAAGVRKPHGIYHVVDSEPGGKAPYIVLHIRPAPVPVHPGEVYSSLRRLRVKLEPAPVHPDMELFFQPDQAGPLCDVAERSDEIRIKHQNQAF